MRITQDKTLVKAAEESTMLFLYGTILLPYSAPVYSACYWDENSQVNLRNFYECMNTWLPGYDWKPDSMFLPVPTPKARRESQDWFPNFDDAWDEWWMDFWDWW